MGLESMNFFFRSEEQIESRLTSNENIVYNEGKKYVYKKDNNFWIDIEFQDSYSLSLRITLSNPSDTLLPALHHLILYLFKFRYGKLTDMHTKKVYQTYNDDAKRAIEKSFWDRKKVFQDIYGNYTAAISSEEFYKRIR